MRGGIVIRCLLPALLLLPTSAIKTLYTVEELSGTGYGCPFPRNGLQLLCWLAQSAIYFDNNRVMRARFHNSQYGFHYYGNYENLLPVLQWDQQYFIVGNLNYCGAEALPDSVRAAYDRRRGYAYEYNMDRIIVQRRRNSNEIRAVYITEHQPGSGSLSSQNTFRISPQLIRHLQSTPLSMSFRNLQVNNWTLNAGSNQATPSQDQTFHCCLLFCFCFFIIFILAVVFFRSQ